MQIAELRYLAKHEPLWSRVPPERARLEQRDSDLWMYIQRGWIVWAGESGYRITRRGREVAGIKP